MQDKVNYITDEKTGRDVIIPTWLSNLFENYDRTSLDNDTSMAVHVEQLTLDAEKLIELIEYHFTGYSLDNEITGELVALHFVKNSLIYLDEVA
tara:strand:+ start:312 stop:593 length:282 start_codon:yes stop_codon:yes gene_type:complete